MKLQAVGYLLSTIQFWCARPRTFDAQASEAQAFGIAILESLGEVS